MNYKEEMIKIGKELDLEVVTDTDGSLTISIPWDDLGSQYQSGCHVTVSEDGNIIGIKPPYNEDEDMSKKKREKMYSGYLYDTNDLDRKHKFESKWTSLTECIGSFLSDYIYEFNMSSEYEPRGQHFNVDLSLCTDMETILLWLVEQGIKNFSLEQNPGWKENVSEGNDYSFIQYWINVDGDVLIKEDGIDEEIESLPIFINFGKVNGNFEIFGGESYRIIRGIPQELNGNLIIHTLGRLPIVPEIKNESEISGEIILSWD